MRYEEFQLLATQVQEIKAEGAKWVTFKVQVPHSPAGEIISGVDSRYNARMLRERVGQWGRMQLTWSHAIESGHLLARVLFPEAVRDLLIRSRDIVKTRGQRLRIRLMLEGVLNNLPWEYVLLNPGGGEATATDFLALSPDISIVRHQAASIPAWDVEAALPAQLLVALANPAGVPKLDLDKERHAIAAVIKDQPHLSVRWKDPATPETILADVDQAHLFHFAGHGQLKTEMAEKPGALTGEGFIILDDGFGEPQKMSASQLALQLRRIGVRVAILGACESGRRDDVNVWSSVAAALLKAELSAVVGMQYKVRDDSAIAFAGELYAGLVAGLTIDEAVTNGRIKVAQRDVAGWGTPVLYLRSSEGVIFPEYAANPELEPARKNLRIRTEQEVAIVRGTLTGITAKVATGDLVSIQKIGIVEAGAQATGVDAEQLGADSIDVRQDAQSVDGNLTGVRINTIGGAGPRAGAGDPPSAGG